MQVHIGDVFPCVGIVAASQGANPSGQLAPVGPAIASKEEPVFQQVGQASTVGRVVEVTRGDRADQS
jgi:hypothetical protein